MWLSPRTRSTALDVLVPLLFSVAWSATASEVSTPTLAVPGTSARARAAEACEERRREAAVPLAPAFHGAAWTLAGSLSPVSSRAPPDSPSPDWVPPVPSAGWPPMVRTAARASAVD